MGWFSDAKTTSTHPTPSREKTLTPVEALCEALVNYPAEWEEQKKFPEGVEAIHTLRHTSGTGVMWEHQGDDEDDMRVWIAPHGNAWVLLNDADAEQVEGAIVKNAALRVSRFKPPFAVEES